MKNSTVLSASKAYLALLVAVAFLVIYLLVDLIFVKINSPEKSLLKFQGELNHKIDQLDSVADLIYYDFSINKNINWEKFDKIFNNTQLKVYVYSKDSLVYWNTQFGEFYFNDIPECKIDTLIIQNSESYLVHYDACDTFKITIYSPISAIMPESVKNLLQLISLNDDVSKVDFIIKNREEKEIIALKVDDNFKFYGVFLNLIFIIYFAFIISLTIAIFHLYKRFKYLKNKPITQVIMFFASLVIFRAIDYCMGFPKSVKQSFLFDNSITNIILFASLGDILLSGVIVLIGLVVVFNNLNFEKIKQKSRLITILTHVFASLSLVLTGYFYLSVIKMSVHGLNYDSLTGIELGKLATIGAIPVLLVYTAAFYFLLKIIEKLVVVSRLSQQTAFVSLFVFTPIIYFLGFFEEKLVLLSFLMVLLIMSVLSLNSRNNSIYFVRQILFIFIFTSFVALVINMESRDKYDEHQLLSAQLLSKEKDSELEKLFEEAYPNIVSDTVFSKMLINPENDKTASNYLNSKYFQKLKNSYSLQVILCNTGELLKIQPEGYIVDCSEYFDKLISNSGKAVVDSTLFLINDETESIYYVGKLKLESLDKNLAENFIFLEFFNTIIPEGLGYTELLNDYKTDLDLTGYSFAWYKKNQLIYKFGNFPYQTNFDFFDNYMDGKFFDILGYRNLKIKISSDKFFIISRPTTPMTAQLAFFSIIFIIFGTVILLVFLFVYRQNAIKFLTLNFRIRLQFFFITTITLMMVLFAVITFYFLKNNNATGLKSELNEKTQSVIIELQHKLSAVDNKYDKENLYQLLSKFSMVFFNDINLYDNTGKLLAASRPEIFTRGLQSTRINPEAYKMLKFDNQLYFLTEEKLGNLTYNSSYAPLVLDQNQLFGFINLPSFARQYEAEKSYYLLFSAFINLFVLLGILGTLLALLLSRILIKPLAVLQTNLATIQIGKPNTKITWKIDDELGLLIKEYNKMIDKLEQSTILLKHSERESAWREVARQIAHEIKNPLTPMKLNVQYLEKAYVENDPNFEEKIKNISASLVMQIDTLDKVAEMFSDFAKTKNENFEKVDLLKTVNSSMSLFKNNNSIKFEINTEEKISEYSILAYEKDILRVFNNLIKNSIQSLEGKPSGKIEISFKSDEKHIFIEVADNGKGMTDDAKANIFQPYFTTKTGGTGLGLAIVKNIMNEIGGEITFESTIEHGTSFILKFNRYK